MKSVQTRLFNSIRHPYKILRLVKRNAVLLRTQIGVWTAALLTGLVGIVNLFSAVTPGLPQRIHWLKEFFPFDIRASAHIFTAITGFLLLTLAAHLLRRKYIAWWLTVGLLVTSILAHLTKGFDYEESLLSAVLLTQLIWMRSLFTAKSDPPSVTQGVRVLVGALLFTLAYGTAGFFLLDRAYTVNFDLRQAILQTLAMFFTEDNAGLQPINRFGDFFADSIYVVGATTMAYALFMLLRPVLLRGEPATKAERERAKAIVEQYGRSSLARFTLFDDKAYYFSPTGRSVIAYVPKGRGAVALGDPIGPADDRRETIVGFQQFCKRNDWIPAFYQTLPDDLELYKSLGFSTLQIGEEAVVDLKTFTLQGKAARNFRNAVNRLTKEGYQVKFYAPPLSDDLLKQLRVVSDEWLVMMQGAEKKFSLGWFDDAYLRDCEVAVVHNSAGQIVAFTNIVSEYQLNEVTIDLTRRCKEMEHGVMEFLYTIMLQRFQAEGYDGFNLGLSALSGVGNTKRSPKIEKTLHYLYEHLNRFYNFKGLYEFKDKFRPRWEPRFLVYPGLTALPDVVVALVRADSGDRLLDYFKPDS